MGEQAFSHLTDGSVNSIKLFLELSGRFQNSYSGIPLFRKFFFYCILKFYIIKYLTYTTRLKGDRSCLFLYLAFHINLKISLPSFMKTSIWTLVKITSNSYIWSDVIELPIHEHATTLHLFEFSSIYQKKILSLSP